jgi:CSLREA domain-containing protein
LALALLAGLLPAVLPRIVVKATGDDRPVKSKTYQVSTAAAVQQTFTVNSTVDAVDANPGNGVCASVSAGCTLRAAIQEANATPGGNAEIMLPAGLYTLTLAGSSENAAATGDLDITKSVTITGAGAGQTIIDGNSLDRVLDIRTVGIVVQISGVTIRNGAAEESSGFDNGGGIRILAGQVSISGSVITQNSASAGSFNVGGGIYIEGQSSLTVSNTTVSNNSADQGGGIYADLDVSGTVNINGSTINNNTALTTGFGAGGGIYIQFGGNVSITNSTISGNGLEEGLQGGGIYIQGGSLSLKSVTISGNKAQSGAGSGIDDEGASGITSQNTIFDNGPAGHNCAGNSLVVTSSGHNIDGDGTCITAPATGDQRNVNPLLGPLANNGGPTQTHALLTNSPAIDKGQSSSLNTDQRGFTRPVDNPAIPNATGGDGSDIGAFEVQAATAAGAELVGTITTPDLQPLPGVVVQLDGTRSSATITDSLGRYSFSALEPLGFYNVTPSRVDFTFSPQSRAVTFVGNRVEAVFTANAAVNATANPLDTEMFFVRQQYLDFLGREPDAGGLAYWTREITRCGGHADCIRDRRNDVSAAFFASEEFQQTGFFIYRMYKAGLGRRLSYAEFSADHLQVLAGANLEASRAAFSTAFVQREEFVRKYEDYSSGASFVDALLATVRNTGVEMLALRNSLTASYQLGGDLNQSRALVVRELVENAGFKQSQYNPSFVLMEYFGYLRRDPDAGGYDFWQEVLNKRAAENYRGMVCAFITSAEYQRRFSSIVSHSDRDCGQ